MMTRPGGRGLLVLFWLRARMALPASLNFRYI